MNWTAEAFHKDNKDEPTTWVTTAGEMQIIVTRHVYFPDTWTLLCKDLGFDMIDLHTEDVEIAKVNALVKVKQTVSAQLTKLQKVLKDLP